MKTLTLKRVVDNLWGTPGVLYDSDKFMLTTLERKWEGNQHDISCIPDGKYISRRGKFPSHGDTFEVTGVKDRSGILFHKGNYQTDSKGCILLGSGYAEINGQLAISGSGDAFKKFMEYLKDEHEFELLIKAA